MQGTDSHPLVLPLRLEPVPVLNLGAVPLGAVLAGLLAQSAGTRQAIVLLTATYAASGLLLALGPLRGRRDLPVRPAPAD